MVEAALDGRLNDIPMVRDRVFGLEIPESCPGVPSDILQPRNCWSDPAAYDAQAIRLAEMFYKNFSNFSDDMSPEIFQAGPVHEVT
jgi:phosphoenolpyruvate carboxykinase (ATP)